VPVEIERKFLVAGDGWREGGPSGGRCCQGYLADGATAAATVRVRRADPAAYLTVKGPGGHDGGLARPEYEYPIPVDDAEAMLANLCRRPLIAKTRHAVAHAGRVRHVDVFEGGNAGLVLAEVELARADALVELPPWVGAEVTADPRYRNSAMLDRPMGRGRG
jgi:CYTH domain-containing protein